jgi:hypothetical protein
MVAYHHLHLSISENISECLMKHQYVSDMQSWNANYDISVLLRCTPKLEGKLSIELCFRDDIGQHKVLVERCENTLKRNHLLTGRCALNVTGKINHAELTITTSEMYMFDFIETDIKLSENGYITV